MKKEDMTGTSLQKSELATRRGFEPPVASEAFVLPDSKLSLNGTQGMQTSVCRPEVLFRSRAGLAVVS